MDTRTREELIVLLNRKLTARRDVSHPMAIQRLDSEISRLEKIIREMGGTDGDTGVNSGIQCTNRENAEEARQVTRCLGGGPYAV